MLRQWVIPDFGLRILAGYRSARAIDFSHKLARVISNGYRNFSRNGIHSSLTMSRTRPSSFFLPIDTHVAKIRPVCDEWSTYLSSCWSNRPSPPEVVPAGGSALSATARDRTQTLPLPARVAARRSDWRQKPRSAPSYCDNGCAERMGIGWRTTFWGCSCRRSRHCTPDSSSTILLSSLSPGPLPGPTSLSSTVPRLFKTMSCADVSLAIKCRLRSRRRLPLSRDRVAFENWMREPRKLIESESAMIRRNVNLFLENRGRIRHSRYG